MNVAVKASSGRGLAAEDVSERGIVAVLATQNSSTDIAGGRVQIDSG